MAPTPTPTPNPPKITEEEAATKIQAVFRGHDTRKAIEERKEFVRQPTIKGCSDLWEGVNHLAICVTNIGRSLNFYANVVGMRQAIRPNFDRHGAWLSMGNLDLHLIKGRPAVHLDDDLIVGHIAIPVPPDRMCDLRERLITHAIEFRKNISVPNPSEDGGKGDVPVEQFFVRDPDGYYIEFCTCDSLEGFLQERMEAAEAQVQDMNALMKAAAFGKRLSEKAQDANLDESTANNPHPLLEGIKDNDTERGLNQALNRLMTKIQNGDMQVPSWMLPDEEIKMKEMNLGPNLVDEVKLANLVKRRQTTYGDIVQNASEAQLRWLMIVYKNDVPEVIKAIQDWMTVKGSQTHIPPAFYERDGHLYQPPSFELPNIKQY